MAMEYRELLQAVLHSLSRPGATEAKQGLPPISRRIAQCVTELVAAAELLKGTNSFLIFSSKLVEKCSDKLHV